MKLLSVNVGSSSLKFRFYEMPTQEVLIKGVFERIGLEDSFYTIKFDGGKIEKKVNLENHTEAVKCLVDEMLESGIISNVNEIDAVGHRIVHGGDKYDKSIIITNEVLEDVRGFCSLAPLHNPAGIAGVEAFQKILKDVKMVACFDTAFHQTLEKDKFLYPVPYEWYTEYGVRKYGFHGMSHKYISVKMAEMLNKKVNLIICHIGNGASLSAINNGKCIDTSMGLTPNSGLMMGTRCGDIDYSLIDFVIEKSGKSLKDIDALLNKQSGLEGIAKMSDLRDIDDAFLEGKKEAVLAVEMYTDRIVKYIADYYLKLNGEVDAICFTAGVGENDPLIRAKVINKLKPLGITLDVNKNEETLGRKGVEGIISGADSKHPVYVLGTDEELMIALDTYNLTK